MEQKIKVKILPQNEEYEINFNETVLRMAQRNDVHIQSVCKGIPSCAECRVRIVDGEHHVLPPSSKEVSLIGTAHYIDRSRLACQLKCFGDVTINMDEQIEKQDRAVKAPQGAASKKEGEESFAVKGNLIDEIEDDGEVLNKSEDSSERRGGDFYTPMKSKGPKSNKKKTSRGANTKKASSHSNHRDEGGGDGPKKKKRRNRSRNRKRGSGDKPAAAKKE